MRCSIFFYFFILLVHFAEQCASSFVLAGESFLNIHCACLLWLLHLSFFISV